MRVVPSSLLVAPPKIRSVSPHQALTFALPYAPLPSFVPNDTFPPGGRQEWSRVRNGFFVQDKIPPLALLGRDDKDDFYFQRSFGARGSAARPQDDKGAAWARRRCGEIPASDRVLFALTWLCTFPQYIVHKLKIFHKISNKLWHKPLTRPRIRCYNRKRTESPAALWRANTYGAKAPKRRGEPCTK